MSRAVEVGCARRAVLGALVAWGLAGCAAAPGAEPLAVPEPAKRAFSLQWGSPLTRKPGDGVAFDGPGEKAVLTVTSSAGVGQALLQPIDSAWPRELVLEFQYAPGRPFTALEGLRLQTRQTSYDSSGDWPTLELDQLLMRRSGKQFWIALPEGWLSGQQPLRLEWVDRYRR